MRRTAENVISEGAASRCTPAIKRRVLRKQAKKARADHALQCSMMFGKKIPKRAFDGVVCQWQIQGRQRRLESQISTILRWSVFGSRRNKRGARVKTRVFQEEGRPTFHEDWESGGNPNWMGLTSPRKHVAKSGQRARRCHSKRDDQTVTAGKIHVITKHFPQRFMERVEAPSYWKIVKLEFCKKRTQNTKKESEAPGLSR